MRRKKMSKFYSQFSDDREFVTKEDLEFLRDMVKKHTCEELNEMAKKVLTSKNKEKKIEELFGIDVQLYNCVMAYLRDVNNEYYPYGFGLD